MIALSAAGTKRTKRVVLELNTDEYRMLKKLKGEKTWREFILDLVKLKEEVLESKIRELCIKLQQESNTHYNRYDECK